MRARLLAWALSASLLLTGCSALLEREYSSVTPHSAVPATEGDPSILRADSYQELVNALIYLVSDGMEEGTVRLYADAEAVDTLLSDACLEVVQEDPLGAYCVEFIKYTVDPVVAYSEARVEITYRRSREQVASILQATGVTAIRGELESALTSFAPERVLRVRYFEENASYIQELARQAYYNVPACALGMPDLSVFIYPDAGRQRIVEVLLSYPLERSELETRRDALAERLKELAGDLAGRTDLPVTAALALLNLGKYNAQGGSAVNDLFDHGSANSEGLALAYAALCQQLELPCQVARGARQEESHFWNVVQTEKGWRHIDLSAIGQTSGPGQEDHSAQEDGEAGEDDPDQADGQAREDEPEQAGGQAGEDEPEQAGGQEQGDEPEQSGGEAQEGEPEQADGQAQEDESEQAGGQAQEGEPDRKNGDIRKSASLYTDLALQELGYLWEEGSLPACTGP